MPGPSPTDFTQRFLLENLDIRGQVVLLGPLWRAILARRAYPESMRQLVAEFSALAVLIATGLKHPGRVVLQVMGHGPVSMAVADCTRELALRAMLKGGEGLAKADPASLPALFADGRLALTIENYDSARHFQSIVPLEGATLAECFEHYFDRSEQVPTHVWVQATTQGVGALILQKLPRADERDPLGWARVQRQAAQRAPFLLEHFSANPLPSREGNESLPLPSEEGSKSLPLPSEEGSKSLPLPPGEGRGEGGKEGRGEGWGEGRGEGIAGMLTTLFPEDDVRLYQPHAVRDGCTRSEEKVVAMLRGLGRAEVEATLAEHGVVTVHDEICNQEYRFSAADVARIFAA